MSYPSKLMKMFTDSPASSPTSSEISVGSPSPPITQEEESCFSPLKKVRMCKASVKPSSPSSIANNDTEKTTGFRIADILGHTEKSNRNNNKKESHLVSRIVRPWDHFHETNSLKNILPTSFLTQDHRISLEYHHQLQIHLRAQAQFLRHLNFDVVASESGSDRSSSTASDCCSPEINNRLTDISQVQSKSINSSHHISGTATPLDALFKMTNKSFDDSQKESGKKILIFTKTNSY